MVQYKAQRVGVFVDVQNMYYSAKNLFEAKVNFGKVLEEAVGARELIRAIAYTVKGPQSEEDNFFAALSKIGFEVKMRPLQVFLGGAKKGDWDVGMCMDAIRMAGKLDVVVLVSGDGDFEPLVSYLKYSEGCVVEVMAFAKTTSSKLKEEADAFTDLGESKKFLLRK
ncbi:MAG: NYN domain-containing protein [Candidatus Sungbacteria bacterium]|uniref:NYN domain-containing protein n=1 Tax=Candidatus Sungiibacteriota bacterium TaxID=2750080 RepID=A0A933DS85_9BACT|nr:NYN domain-containing protein [Parcubacteria group bacterium]MBI4132940.1 NYN domain-containing protein [Candidatus Sungbacteria bacterium]